MLLERRDQAIARLYPALGDDEGLDARETVDLDAHDSALRHRRVLEQRRLDLDRRRPQAADLDHVVGPSLVPVVAVLVDAIPIAREEPVAEDRPLGLLMLRPVQRERAVALHVEVAGIAGGHWLSFLVEDLQLVSGNRLATRSGAHVVEPVGAVDVQHLGRPDAVEDREPVRLLPAPPDLGRKRLRGGDAMANRAEISAARALEVEEGRRGEEECRPAFLDGVEDRRGGMPSRVQHSAGADPVRHRQVVAEAVGVKEARGREGGIALFDSEHLLAVGNACVRNVVLKMDHRLRLSGRAGAVQPEGHVVPAGRCWLDLLFDRDLARPQKQRWLGGTIGGRLQLLLGGAVDDHHLRERVFDEVVVVLGALEQRVDRNRHRSEPDRAQEGGDPAGAVVGDDEDPLLPSDTELFECSRRATGQLEQLAVADVAAGRVDRDLVCAAAVQVPVEQVGGDVVAIRQIEPTHSTVSVVSGRGRRSTDPGVRRGV